MSYTTGQTVYVVSPGERYDHATERYVPWAYVHEYRYLSGDGQTLALVSLHRVEQTRCVDAGQVEFHPTDRVFAMREDAERLAGEMRRNDTKGA